MSRRLALPLLAAAILFLPATHALAQEDSRASAGSSQAPGAIVRQQTERSAHEPGVTNELAPDAKETATGGPSGGIPGRSGN